MPSYKEGGEGNYSQLPQGVVGETQGLGDVLKGPQRMARGQKCEGGGAVTSVGHCEDGVFGDAHRATSLNSSSRLSGSCGSRLQSGRQEEMPRTAGARAARA